LVTSFWISGAAAPSGLKLGLQHSAASMAAGRRWRSPSSLPGRST
jgi:hypothetical protein